MKTKDIRHLSGDCPLCGCTMKQQRVATKQPNPFIYFKCTFCSGRFTALLELPSYISRFEATRRTRSAVMASIKIENLKKFSR